MRPQSAQCRNSDSKVNKRELQEVKQMLSKPPNNIPIAQKSKQNLEDQICVICMDKNADSVLMPCGHGGFCNSCALDQFKKSNGCPMCRKVGLQYFCPKTPCLTLPENNTGSLDREQQRRACKVQTCQSGSGRLGGGVEQRMQRFGFGLRRPGS